MCVVDLEPYWYIVHIAFEIWSSQSEKHLRQGIFKIVQLFSRITVICFTPIKYLG